MEIESSPVAKCSSPMFEQDNLLNDILNSEKSSPVISNMIWNRDHSDVQELPSPIQRPSPISPKKSSLGESLKVASKSQTNLSPTEISPKSSTEKTKISKRQDAESSFISDLSEIDIIGSFNPQPEKAKTGIRSMADQLRNCDPSPRKETREIRSITSLSSKITKNKEELDLDSLFEAAKKNNPKRLKEINKINHSKTELLAEMVLEVDQSVYSHFPSLQEYLTVRETHMSQPLIIFKRVKDKVYDPRRDIFIPIDSSCEEEDGLKCIFLEASDLVERFLASNLEELLTKRDDCTTILLIEGLESYMQKIRNRKNREYISQVRSQFEDESRRKSRKTTNPLPDVDYDKIKEYLESMQIIYGVQIFPTKNLNDSLEWIKSLAYTQATSIYDKSERQTSLAGIGNVKSGVSEKEVVSASLKQLKFVTNTSAERIQEKFPTIPRLHKAAHSSRKLGMHNDGKPLARSSIENAIVKLFTSCDASDFID